MCYLVVPSCWTPFNPCHMEFISENININLYFLWLLLIMWFLQAWGWLKFWHNYLKLFGYQRLSVHFQWSQDTIDKSQKDPTKSDYTFSVNLRAGQSLIILMGAMKCIISVISHCSCPWESQLLSVLITQPNKYSQCAAGDHFTMALKQ